MEARRILLGISSILFLFIMILSSCDKDNNDDDDNITDNNTSAEFENAVAEAIFDDVQNIADQASNGNDLTTYINMQDESVFSGCATVNLDLTATPHVLTVDFGSSNCLCKDNRYRRGKIIVTFNGAYWDSGTVLNHSFDNYYVNDYKVNGTKSVTNNGRNSGGNISFSISVNSTIEKPNNGGTITWNSNRTREWIEGDTTLTWMDDVYLITGSGNGITSDGTSYTIDITKALRVEIGCKHIVSGTWELTPAGKLTRVVDYGNGVCDDEITVTVGSLTIKLNLG